MHMMGLWGGTVLLPGKGMKHRYHPARLLLGSQEIFTQANSF